MSWFGKEKLGDINEENIEDIVKRAEVIDRSGTDAQVFKYGGSAIHEYDSLIDLPLLNLYRELVQQATVFSGRQRTVAGHNLIFEVVTMDKIIQAKTAKLYGISRFVPGGNLFDRNRQNHVDRQLYAGTELWLREMTNELAELTGRSPLTVSFSPANTTLNERIGLLSATDICTHMIFLNGRSLTEYFG